MCFQVHEDTFKKSGFQIQDGTPLEANKEYGEMQEYVYPSKICMKTSSPFLSFLKTLVFHLL